MKARRSVISLFEADRIAVLGFDPECLRLARFVRRSRRWAMERLELFETACDSPGREWHAALAAAGRGSQLVLLTGEVPGGVFFECPSAELASEAQRGVLELELPRRLLKVPELPVMQFLPGAPDAEGRVTVKAYVFGREGMAFLLDRLALAGGRADDFCFPLLALEPGDPPVRLAGSEPDFFFHAGAWRRISDENAAAVAQEAWRERCASLFDLPAEFPGGFAKWLPVMLAALPALRGEFRRHRSEIRVLPRECRPVRYRGQLILAAALAAALLLVGGWVRGGAFLARCSADRARAAEIRGLRSRTAAIRRELKRGAKERRETAKLLSQPQGERDVLDSFARISKILPRSVMVSSLRWNESGIELVMQSEDGNLDVQTLLRPLTEWKIGQLQQRRFGDRAVTTVTVKLVRADASAPSAKKGSGGRRPAGRRR